MTEKVRYGLLSTAQIGLNAHYPASIESEISEIVSVSSRSAKRAKEVANRNNIERWYGSYEEQLADPDVDAIVTVCLMECIASGQLRLRKLENISFVKNPSQFQ